jgi:hypothetical protein
MDDFTQPTHPFAPAAGGDREGFRWHPWPCPGCSGGQSAWNYLRSRLGPGPAILEVEWEERARTEIDLLGNWIAACPHTSRQELELPRLAEGSEHRVYHRAQDDVVYKHTLSGTFGDNYYLINNRVHQRKCLPLDYLIRLDLWRKVFGWAPMDLGLTRAGQIVTIQGYIVGDIPAQEEVDEYLRAGGFQDVKRQCFIWKKAEGEDEIWVGDTRDENFVKTEHGIIPIDVRLWLGP